MIKAGDISRFAETVLAISSNIILHFDTADIFNNCDD